MTEMAHGLVDDVAELVSCESPSEDLEAVARCADVLADVAQRRIGLKPERIEVEGRVHLRWQTRGARVVLLGHLDTVWPMGTLARWPFTIDGDRMTGPGVFDMKFGLVQMVAAVQSLDGVEGLTMLVTSDEEIGSSTSQALIEDTCRDAQAVLVLEPSADGALKVARKGVGMFRLDIAGKAAHAGLEPHNGINASVEAAHAILAAAGLARPDVGTTVTPTVVSSGTTVNTVPAVASVAVDVRAETVAEMQRVEQALSSLSPQLPGASLKLVTRSLRQPLERAMSADLFARAQQLAATLGLDPLEGVAVGGGSDGNITAGLGVATLDGLGAVGGNAHAEGEWASMAALPDRVSLVAALVRDLLEDAR
ncbi:MAG TPA: M20/M25/M40 family metallo-hydrolase [Mycobacteriales bacterium]|nr:M20/M25/M40 family metallo-hydrolase [Mycobacteriales bacterium]